MNTAIVIPTYVGSKRRNTSYNVVATYDHVTPLTHQGELVRCLASLRNNNVFAPIILLVGAESGVEAEAAQKIREVAASFADDMDIRVIDCNILRQFNQRVEQLGFSQVKEGISLTGYGAIRNFGLVVAATLGFTEVVFIDDDEIIIEDNFLESATYGLGKLSKKGIPVLVKSGFFIDRGGKWKSRQSSAWYNRYWEQGALFNDWITRAMSAPRLSRSNVLYGGLMAIHREAFRRVAFDPWIPRGEDLDYLLNIRMCGGSVWFDNQWCVQHLPPTERNEAQRFKQDIYRWIYEHRKLEFSRTQIDLLQIQPHSLDPYPGPFLDNSITKRVFMTAVLRTIGRAKDRSGYLKAAQAARREAKAYAEMFCSKYFEFQLGWAQVLSTLENDAELKALFSVAARPDFFGSAGDALAMYYEQIYPGYAASGAVPGLRGAAIDVMPGNMTTTSSGSGVFTGANTFEQKTPSQMDVMARAAVNCVNATNKAVSAHGADEPAFNAVAYNTWQAAQNPATVEPGFEQTGFGAAQAPDLFDFELDLDSLCKDAETIDY